MSQFWLSTLLKSFENSMILEDVQGHAKKCSLIFWLHFTRGERAAGRPGKLPAWGLQGD